MQSTDLRSLNDEPRNALPTSEAALHLSLTPRTFRACAHYRTGPITPIAVTSRLCWPVDAFLRALNGDTDISNGGVR
jgi:hypothetical protein